MFARRVVASISMLAAAAAVLTACSGSHSSPSQPTGSATPTSSGASSLSSGAPTSAGGSSSSSASPLPTYSTGPNAGQQILTPASNSPAIKTFGVKRATDALNVARSLAYASVGDTTLLTPTAKDHPARDFAAVTQYLTPAAQKAFDTDLTNGSAGNMSDVRAVNALALSINQASTFQPDVPVKLLGEEYAPNEYVDVFTPQGAATPDMVVSGKVIVYIEGSDIKSGAHGRVTVTRNFSYSLALTGNPDNPVAVAGWRSNVNISKVTALK